jgi:predicted nucleic acid-binding Zn ribbon protein
MAKQKEKEAPLPDRCPACGYALKIGQTKCPHCGYEITKSEKSKKINKVAIIVGVVFLVLIIVAAIVVSATITKNK